MQHFYVKNDKIEGHRLSLEGEDYNHCINVLRMKKGEAFIACDESGKNITASSILLKTESFMPIFHTNAQVSRSFPAR